jgi:hypothetical protein
MARAGLAATLVVALAAVMGLGCGSSKDENTSAGSTPPRTQRKPPVPASLGRVESGAEDTIDFAHPGSRAKVVSTARRLRRVADDRASADLRRAGARQDQLFALRERTHLLEAIAPRAAFDRVALAANRISALMPAFYARYRDPVPPEVLKLDYLDREAHLRSLAGDRASVQPTVAALTSTWRGLRARVLAAGGDKIAARFSRHVRAMRRLARGADERTLQQEAAVGLELVDRLERQFRRR